MFFTLLDYCKIGLRGIAVATNLFRLRKEFLIYDTLILYAKIWQI